MAELPHSSRRFRSPPPHLESGMQSWFSNLTLLLERLSMNVRLVTAATDSVLYDDGFVECDATAANIILNLPPAENVTGRVYAFIKSDVSANTVTIDGDDSEEINGVTTKVLSAQYAVVIIISTGDAWLVLSAS